MSRVASPTKQSPKLIPGTTHVCRGCFFPVCMSFTGSTWMHCDTAAVDKTSPHVVDPAPLVYASEIGSVSPQHLLGALAVCRMCSHPIRFNGEYWTHRVAPGYPEYRHRAAPTDIPPARSGGVNSPPDGKDGPPTPAPLQPHAGLYSSQKTESVEPTVEVYVGLDPGAEGGIAVIAPGRVELHPLGTMTLPDCWDAISSAIRPPGEKGFALLEKVGGFIKGSPQTGSTMFSFGASYGRLQAFLVAAAIPFQEVMPQKWQSGLGCRKRKQAEEKGHWKTYLKGFAQQLFPGETVTKATADALLMAEYARRIRTGEKK